MEGFIKLYRQLKEWEWYKDGNTMRVFIHLLLSANHKPGRWKGIEIKRGQVLSGRKSLASELDLTENEIRTAIWHLKTTNEITTEVKTAYTIFSLTNYDLYQSYTTDETTNLPPTYHQPTTTNNNENTNKNEKNNKKNINKKKKKTGTKNIEEKTEVETGVFLRPEEDKKTRDLYGTFYKRALLKLSSFKVSNGKEYQEDYATLHTGGWVYKAMLKDFPSLWQEIAKRAIDAENKRLEEAQKWDKEKIEEEYKALLAFYNTLSEEEKKAINARADFELKSWTPAMREYGGGKKWEEIFRAKVRSVTSTYRDTGEIPEVPPPPAEKETLTPNT